VSLSITGYVLDPVRVGVSTSPFTLSPDNLISNQTSFDSAYPSDESEPRAEYLVQVLEESFSGPTGPDGRLSLPDARFFWTKNEGEVQNGVQIPFQRFDYSGLDQRFKTLQGLPATLLGTLQADSNTNRLAVEVIPLMTSLSNYPVRITTNNPTNPTLTLTVLLVDDDGSFGSPSSGTVELSRSTGNLHWNTTDVTNEQGREVYFQRQSFGRPSETTGSIGVIGTDDLVLTPIPATGQVPLLRMGNGGFAAVVEVGSFGSPSAGTIEWQTGTGVLNLNATDLGTYAGQPLLYEGAAVQLFQVPTATVGTVSSPGTVSPFDEGEDLYFRVSGVVQFPTTKFVDAFTTGRSGEVQVRRSDGQVQTSAADQSKYGASTLEVVRPDIELENGHTLRLFRTPVDPANVTTAQDVTATYEKVGAILADPIVGQPAVFLPATPLDTEPLTVRVTQGTGFFVGTLQRLDAGSPTGGLGYVIDASQRQLQYGFRTENFIVAPPTSYGAVQLPLLPIFQSGLVVELEETAGVGDWQTLTVGQDFVVDYASGVVSFTQTSGEVKASGTTDSTAGSTLTDALRDFTAEGVGSGNTLEVYAGVNQGVYTVATVGTETVTVTPAFPGGGSDEVYEIRTAREVLADRFFREIPSVDPNTTVERLQNLGTTVNSPRLSVDTSHINVSRFRFGSSTFSTTVTTVVNDGAFTAPASLAVGEVEVSLDTGNLNFSQTDVTEGLDVFWARTLTLGVDYKVQSGLGFLEFTERLFSEEELVLNYAHLDDVLSDGTVVKTAVVDERGAFLVSKELTQDHPDPTNTLSFNPEGREVASSPTPRAYRGGRPQRSDQVSFDVTASTVTFTEPSTVTDALPSGSRVDPSENVYVDYYILGALGGEKNVSVLQPPMATVTVVIEEGGTSFTVEGDRTAEFLANHVLLLNRTDAYLIGSSSFDGTDTTVTLDQSPPQSFKSDYRNPTLKVTSGEIRRVAAGIGLPAYFETEASSFDPVPRGSNRFKILGDVTRLYQEGVVVLYTDDTTFQDYSLVEGSEYNASSNRTTVTLSSNVRRGYDSLTTVRRTIRAILKNPSADVFTSAPPLSGSTFNVYKQTEGDSSELLARGTDYTLDDAGRLSFTEPLDLNESWSISYTGSVLIEVGRRVRATWNAASIPSVTNGLLNQTLVMDYTTYVPDTFYYRVETMTNFRGELLTQFNEDAKARASSQGPILENTPGARLHDQGNEGLFFKERDLVNQDVVAVPTLKYYNDAINHLEDYLQACDGRVVGDGDGRFLFDGNLDNPVRSSFATVTNQIDDYVELSGNMVVQAYEASAVSRFYPTTRVSIGDTEDTTSLDTGDTVFDTGHQPLTTVNSIRRRFPFAMVTVAAEAGATVLTVDDADGNSVFTRPAFPDTVVVEVVDQDGTPIDTTGLTVDSSTPTTITLSGGVAAPVPVGATVRLSETDTAYQQSYIVDVDVGVNSNDGLLTFVEAGDVPPPFTPKTFLTIEQWDVDLGTSPSTTRPERAPFLDGGVSDDDGDVQTPLLTPRVASELALSPLDGLSMGLGLLDLEAGYLTDIQADAVDPFQGVGDVSGGTLTVTTPSSFPTTPRRGDLVQILDGVHGPSNYVRVLSADPTTITLEESFSADTGLTFTVTTVTAPLVSSGSTSDTNGTSFNDTGEDFVSAGVLPGHTVVIISGSNDLERRQVASVNSTTSITLVSAFTNVSSGFSYRIDNPVNTFGLASTSSAELERLNLEKQKDVLSDDASSEINALEDYVDSVGTDISSSAAGSTVLSSTFEDLTADFEADGVSLTDYLHITSGADAGFYAVASIDSATELTVGGTFTEAAGSLSYRVIRVSGISLTGLNEVFDVLTNSQTSLAEVNTLLGRLATVTVENDAGAYAQTVRASDITTRVSENTARVTQAGIDTSNIEAVLNDIDRLYNTRFVWIDGRINLGTGILTRKVRAVEDREEALTALISDLTKILTSA